MNTRSKLTLREIDRVMPSEKKVKAKDRMNGERCRRSRQQGECQEVWKWMKIEMKLGNSLGRYHT